MKLFIVIILFPLFASSQIENVIVETYYISDSNDATDTIGGKLEAGTTTYRIYVDLAPNYVIASLYGDNNHMLKFSSTQPIFNHLDRGKSFGYEIQSNKLRENTLALDSWLTIGKATAKHMAVTKDKDTSGSIIGGIYNDGGSAEISQGLLLHNDSKAGIAISLQDGMILDEAPIQYSNFGFINLISGIDSTIFGNNSTSNIFESNNAFISNATGIQGFFSSDNKVLIGQITTKGELSFEINLEIIDEFGVRTKYVANNPNELQNEKLSPYLTYPFSCGCTDRNYLEFSESFACSDSTACKTAIVLGCMDVNACNYNSVANFSVETMCCYPGFCNDRDIAIVCPSVTEIIGETKSFKVFPNPVLEELHLTNGNDTIESKTYTIYDIYGNLMITKNTNIPQPSINVAELKTGNYIIQIESNTGIENLKFNKK